MIAGGSGGIGSVIADYFCRAGAKVIILGRSRRLLKIVAYKIKKEGGLVDFKTVNISNLNETSQVVRGIQKKYGFIDVLVNAAGIQEPIGSFVENDLGQWRKNLEVNLLGTVFLCQLILPAMIKRRSGSIINFSGGGSTSSRTNFSAYAVAKTGVVRFTEILADELKKYRIRVNAIAPGAVNTKMLKEVLRAGARAGAEELASAKKRSKIGGAPPEKAAELVLFLASDKSKPLSGRLISAVWDDWQGWRKSDLKKIMKSDKLTLRRIK
ncbi:MAG: SDR family oxidoreductase [Patescibacteria group bacterium]